MAKKNDNGSVAAMAKATGKRNELPPTPDDEFDNDTGSGGASEGSAIDTALVEVPLGTGPVARFRLHIDLNLSGDSAELMQRIYRGLDQRGDRLKNGRRVNGPNDVVRWMIEQVAENKPD